VDFDKLDYGQYYRVCSAKSIPELEELVNKHINHHSIELDSHRKIIRKVEVRLKGGVSCAVNYGRLIWSQAVKIEVSGNRELQKNS